MLVLIGGFRVLQAEAIVVGETKRLLYLFIFFILLAGFQLRVKCLCNHRVVLKNG